MGSGREVGEPVRRVLACAVSGSAALGLLAFLFLAVGKEAPMLYEHEPWRDDPYDALVSFDLLALPALIALLILRLPLCRADQPLPLGRAAGLLRLSRVVVGLVVFTLASEGLSVVLGTHRRAWTDATLDVLAGLAAVTVLAVGCAWLVHRASRAIPAEGAPAQPDWPADLVTLADGLVGRLSVQGSRPRRLVAWCEAALVPLVRRRPLLVAAAGSVLAAALADAPQAVLEGYGAAFAAYFIGVTACSLYVLCVAVGRYVRVVEWPASSRFAATRVVVLTTASVPLSAAFRNSLWWLVGTDEQHATLARLLLLSVLVGVTVAGSALLTARVRALRAA